jgi:hypothetical protein
VRAYFENGWALTEILFSGLASEEAFFRPPYHGLRHPFIFYYTHPALPGTGPAPRVASLPGSRPAQGKW